MLENSRGVADTYRARAAIPLQVFELLFGQARAAGGDGSATENGSSKRKPVVHAKKDIVSFYAFKVKILPIPHSLGVMGGKGQDHRLPRFGR